MGITKRKRANLGLMALEPRWMFDGAAAVDAAHASPDASAKALIPDVPAPVQVRAADPSKDNGKKEVVFIDTSLADYKALEAAVKAGIEIEEIDGGQSGLAQMSKWAETNSGYDSISLLSHGREATLQVGIDTITDSSLSTAVTRAELAEIGSALKAGGDLLVYGCDVAAGSDGAQFITDIANATGADVAASTNDTGVNGDWTLEARTGVATDTSQLTAAGEVAYQHDLSFSPVLFTDWQGTDTQTNMVVDSAGDIYVTGWYDYNSAPATITLAPGVTINVCGSGVYIIKYNASGTALWGKAIQGYGYDDPVSGGSLDETISVTNPSVGVDGSGNLYISGEMYGTIDFVPGQSSNHGHDVTANSGDYQGFVARINADGTLGWVNLAPNLSIGRFLTVTNSGVIACSTPQDSSSNAIKKFDLTTGQLLWTVTPQGNVAVAGITSDSSGNAYYDTATSLVELNGSDGTALWSKSLASGGIGGVISLDTDGNVVMKGTSDATQDIDNTSGTFNVSVGTSFLGKWSGVNGNFMWADIITPTVSYNVPVTFDSDGNIYTSMALWSTTFDLNPGGTGGQIGTSGKGVIALAEYTSSGTFLWAESFVAPAGQLMNTGLAMAPSGKMYLSLGLALGNGKTLNIDPRASNYLLTQSTAHSNDFIIRYNTDGTLSLTDGPTVTSINRDLADTGVSTARTNQSSVYFTVTFSQAMTGLDASDFAVVGTATGGSVTDVRTSDDGTTWVVQVSGVSGDGTVRLDLKAGADDGSDGCAAVTAVSGGTALAGGIHTGDQSFTIDNTGPTITNVTLDRTAYKVGDTATATITVTSDTDTGYTLYSSSTIDGYTLGNLTRVDNTHWTATFTVNSGGTDVPSGNAVVTFISLSDGVGNSGNWYQTGISGTVIETGSMTVTSGGTAALYVPGPNSTHSSPQAVDPGITVSYPYATTGGGTLTVAITAHDDATHDVLSVGAVGDITVSGTTVSDGGTAIGTIDATNNGSPGHLLVIHLSAADTRQQVQDLAQSINYSGAGASGNSYTASSLARTVSFTVTDAVGLSASATNTVTVEGVPSFDSFSVTYGGSASAPIRMAPNTSWTLPDTILEAFDPVAGRTDTWSVAASPGHGTVFFYDTGNSLYDAATSSSNTSGYGSNKVGWPTGNAQYTPTPGYTGTDNFTLQISNGVNTTTQTYYVVVDSVPTVTVGGATATFVAGGAAQAVDSGMTIGDADAAASAGGLGGGKLAVSIIANRDAAHDILTVGAVGAITVSGNTVSDGGTSIGTIDSTLNGSLGQNLSITLATGVTASQVTDLARAIELGGSGSTASASDRTVQFTVTDGLAQPATTSESIHVQTPPVVSSINRIGGAAVTNASSVSFAVAFNRAVSNVVAADFTLAGTDGSGTIGTPTTSNGGITWVVPVTGISGNGTERLDLTSTGTIAATTGGIALSATHSGDQSFTIDTTAPTITGITLNAATYKVGDTVTATVTTNAYDGNGAYTLAAGSTIDGMTLTGWSYNTATHSGTAHFVVGAGSTEVINGTVAANVQVTDVAGNTSAADTTGISSKTIDTHAPTDISIAGQDTATHANSGLTAGTVIGALGASDASSGDTFTYTLTGADAAKFQVTGGALAVANGITLTSGTVYNVSVTAHDLGGNTFTKAVTITGVSGPSFSSGTAVTFAENASGTVYTATATGSGTVTYALGGADAGKFNLDTTTGILTFKTPPDYEVHASAANSDVYNVTISATDGNGTSTRAVAVTVTDVAPAWTAPGPISLADNSSNSTQVAALTSSGDASSTVWSIQGGNTGGLFAINAATGAVTVADSTKFNFATTPSYSLMVRETDGITNVDHAVIVSITHIAASPPPAPTPPQPPAPPQPAVGTTNSATPEPTAPVTVPVRDGNSTGRDGGTSNSSLSAPAPAITAPPAASSINVVQAPAVIALTTTGQLTSATGDGSFRVPVISATQRAAMGGDALISVRPVTQIQETATGFSFALPADTFAHTRPDAVVNLTAVQQDGQALPPWLAFNPKTGAFTGKPPAGLEGVVVVRVVARDQDGREAIATIRITVGERPAPAPVQGQRTGEAAPAEGAKVIKLSDAARGKPAFTQQLKLAARNAAFARAAALAARVAHS